MCHILLKHTNMTLCHIGIGGKILPKLTFFNLSEPKRKNMLEAAEKEFSRVPLFEASISNIIKTAGIPRGSFYQYFENKDDLYFFLLEEKLKERKAHFLQLLKKYDGDLIEAMTEMYHHFLKMIPDNQERSFLKNAMIYTSNKVENSFSEMVDEPTQKDYFNEIKSIIDTRRFSVSDDETLKHIFKIITAVAFHNLIEKTLKETSEEEALNNFTFRMKLIKQGIYKKDC
jgi:AcrR family transcriptional regulator